MPDHCGRTWPCRTGRRRIDHRRGGFRFLSGVRHLHRLRRARMASMLDRPMLTFLRGLPEGSVASVCTGGLILAAAGVLGGRRAMTRSHPVGTEASAPLARLVFCSSVRPIAAAVCDDRGVVTSGGVSLAIDGTLYLIGCLYGREAQDEVARVIEYNRSFEANRAGSRACDCAGELTPRWCPRPRARHGRRCARSRVCRPRPAATAR
jgi:hypothetical protein